MTKPQRIRVLIVEDNRPVSDMIERLLDSTRFQVVAKAANGQQAVDMAHSLRPDVVLMDYMMPGLNGVEATRLIQEQCPTPVVMLTAYESPELVAQASRAGVGAYLVKPAKASEMERAIVVACARFDDMLALRRLNAELQAEIAERTQTEKALRESEERFRLLVQEMPVLINALGEDNVFLFWNRECEKATGYNAGEITGNPHAVELLYPDASYLQQLLAEWAERGNAFRDWEMTLTPKDGPPKTIAWSNISELSPVPGWKSWAIGVDVTSRQQAEQALEQHAARLALLNDIGARIAAVLDLDELLNRATRLVQENFGYHHVAIFTLDRGRGELVLRARAGAFAHLFPPDHRLKLSQGMVGWVARHGKTLLANDVSTEPNYVNFFPEAIPTHSELSVPIRMREITVGVLDVQSPQLNTFDQNDVMVLETLANQIAVALENASLYESVQRELAERKQVEEALRQSHLQLESRERFINRIIECIPSSLVVFDRTLRIVSVNHNFLEKARRKESEILGHRIEEGFPQVLMEYTRLDQRVKEVFRSGQPLEGGKVSYRAPGLPTRIYYYRLIPLKLALSTAEGAGEVVENVMLLMDDITEREQLGEEVRRAERHLAGVVECANDLVVSMDPQGRIVTWNQAAERVSGSRAERVKGQSLLSLCDPEQEPEMAELLRQLIRGKGVQTTEVDLLTADGQAVPIAWSCSPMRDDGGAVVGIVAVGRDLTERRQLEAQLIQSAKIASLGVMAGGIAHELRNPLGVISAAAQLLLERPDDAPLRTEAAQKIHAATQRASLIIENLLKFARPQSERMREVDLHTLLTETLDLLAHQMALQTIIVKREFQPDLSKITGNPALLQQVFANLILNARNAMAEGGTLMVTTRANDTGQVEIAFSDTGRGIPAEDLSRIFDPFFTTMPVGQGIGLGLSISYSIIQQHQGTLEAKSQTGKGSTFTVRLPVGRET
jgi:PAS domain S-box-containing protein